MSSPFKPHGKIEEQETHEPPAREVRASGTRRARAAIAPQAPGARGKVEVPPDLNPDATLEEVIAHYGRYVLDRVRRGVPAAHVEDVYQNVWLRMTELYDKGVRPQSVFALLSGVIMIQVLDNARARRRFPFCDDGTLARTLVEGRADPEAAAYHDQQRAIVRGLIASLPRQHAELLFWLDVVEIPRDVVAENLGYSLPTLYVMHQRARAAFYAAAATLVANAKAGDR